MYYRNRTPPFRIKYWEHPQLEKLAANKHSLIWEYGLLATKTRPIPELLEWEQEFHDVIWYDRKLILLRNLKDGKETITPEIKKECLLP